jgi:hypothetical protein
MQIGCDAVAGVAVRGKSRRAKAARYRCWCRGREMQRVRAETWNHVHRRASSLWPNRGRWPGSAGTHLAVLAKVLGSLVEICAREKSCAGETAGAVRWAE